MRVYHEISANDQFGVDFVRSIEFKYSFVDFCNVSSIDEGGTLKSRLFNFSHIKA